MTQLRQLLLTKQLMRGMVHTFFPSLHLPPLLFPSVSSQLGAGSNELMMLKLSSQGAKLPVWGFGVVFFWGGGEGQLPVGLSLPDVYCLR